MKTIAKQLAAGTLVALLLLAGNVSAKGTEIKASGNESVETALQLENWMTDENYWNTSSFNSAAFVLEAENKMEVENWMTTTDIWNVNKQFATETEAALEVEYWMTDKNVWEQNETEVEEKLTVEDWMVNPEVWK